MKRALLVVALRVVAGWLWLRLRLARLTCWWKDRHSDTRSFRRIGLIERPGFRRQVVYRCRWCDEGAMDDAAPPAVVKAAQARLGGRHG